MGLAKGIYKYTSVSRKTLSEILSSAKNRCDLLEATDHIPDVMVPSTGPWQASRDPLNEENHP